MKRYLETSRNTPQATRRAHSISGMACWVLILVLLAACGNNAQTVAPQTATIGYGTLESTVSASGSLEARAQMALAFQTAGRVKAVHVKVGDPVKAGQVLAVLDAPELEISLAQAQVNLDIARAKLEQTRQGPRPAQIEAARASLASAQAAYQAALAKAAYQTDPVATAKEALDKAKENLDNAQAAYDQLEQLNRRGQLVVEFQPQKTALENARIEYNTALANYRLALVSAGDNTLRSAELQVSQAQAQLDDLLNTPTSQELVQAEAQVKQAEMAVQQASKSLERATLVAPFDGVVARVMIQPGLWATANTQAIVVADLSQLGLGLTVAETDIARIRVGQSARVTLDALSGVELAAHVESISLVGAVTQGVVNYTVRVVLDETDPALRPGMTASAAIVVDRRENVLLVPSRAVKSSGKNPDGTIRKVVTLLRDNQTITTTVALGLIGDTYSQVLSGLQAGDVVVVPSTTTAQQGGPGMIMRGEGVPPEGFQGFRP